MTITNYKIKETRPSAIQFNRTREVCSKINTTDLKEREFDVGTNDEFATGFMATFRIMDRGLQATLTPESRIKGKRVERYTNLRTTFWL